MVVGTSRLLWLSLRRCGRVVVVIIVIVASGWSSSRRRCVIVVVVIALWSSLLHCGRHCCIVVVMVMVVVALWLWLLLHHGCHCGCRVVVVLSWLSWSWLWSHHSRRCVVSTKSRLSRRPLVFWPGVESQNATIRCIIGVMKCNVLPLVIFVVASSHHRCVIAVAIVVSSLL